MTDDKDQQVLDAETIVNALKLQHERVTAPDLEEKQRRRNEITNAHDAVRNWSMSGFHGSCPSESELRELLGDPGDKDIREALDRWPVKSP